MLTVTPSVNEGYCRYKMHPRDRIQNDKLQNAVCDIL